MKLIILLIVLFFLSINNSLADASCLIGSENPITIEHDSTIEVINESLGLFNDSWRLYSQSDELVVNFFEWGHPLGKIDNNSIIVKSNIGKLNYSYNKSYLIIRPSSPYRINPKNKINFNVSYTKEEFIFYNNFTGLFQVEEHMDQFKDYQGEHHYLNMTINFPYKLISENPPMYIPFLCYPANELACLENFNVKLENKDTPSIQYEKTYDGEKDDLLVLLLFDLLPSPPKMFLSNFEVVDLKNRKYLSKTKITNFYDTELCYKFSKDPIKIEIVSCKSDLEKGNTQITRLKPNETSTEFAEEGNLEIISCQKPYNDWYPLECKKASIDRKIHTSFYPEREQKDFIFFYTLNAEVPKGWTPIKENNSLSILPEIFDIPLIPKNYQCLMEIHLFESEPKINISNNIIQADFSSKIHVPTSISNQHLDISFEREIFNQVLPIYLALFWPIWLFLTKKLEFKKSTIHNTLLIIVLLCSLLGIFVQFFDTTWGEVITFKSVPLIFFGISIGVILYVNRKATPEIPL